MGEKREYFIGLFPEVLQIADEKLREKVLAIWEDVLSESVWERVEEVPKNPLFAGPDDTLLRHTQSVN